MAVFRNLQVRKITLYHTEKILEREKRKFPIYKGFIGFIGAMETLRKIEYCDSTGWDVKIEPDFLDLRGHFAKWLTGELPGRHSVRAFGQLLSL